MNKDILIVKKEKDLKNGAEAFFTGRTVKLKKSFKHQFGICLSNYALKNKIEFWECDMTHKFGHIEYKLTSKN